jgi:hypothetical protein
LVITVLAGSLAIAGCSSSGASGSTTSTSASTSTTTTATTSVPTTTTPVPPAVEKIYKAMQAAVDGAKSVHYVATSDATSSEGTTKLHFVADVGAGAGMQVATWSASDQTGTFTIVSVGSLTYLNADAGSLATFFEAVPAANAATYAGKWISFAPTDALYKSLRSDDLSIEAVATSLKFLPTATKTVGDTIVITGKPAPTTKIPAGVVADAITTIDRATSRPISQVFNVTENGAKETSSITFSAWDAATIPSAPSGSITWVSVAAAIAASATTTTTTAP